MSLDKIGESITFNRQTFITEYYDKEGDLPFDVLILTLPQYGIIKFNNKVINKVPFTFNISDVNKFSYTRLSSQEYTENISFKTSDDNLNKLYSDMATITINVNPYNNLPPDEVGNNELTVDYGELVVFTSEDFTSNTVPPYEDPEGDAPYKLKILSLPPAGNILQFEGKNVTVGQEILFTQIDLGLLTLITNVATSGGDYSFNFAVSDVGSQQFTS